MAKAYGEPLIGVSAIAQNLRATSGPLSGALVRRLSTDVLGRGDAVTVANTKYQSGPLPSAYVKKSLIRWTHIDIMPSRLPTFFHEEPKC
jgi:hypothetical protein